jgi:hypothetical protein
MRINGKIEISCHESSIQIALQQIYQDRALLIRSKRRILSFYAIVIVKARTCLSLPFKLTRKLRIVNISEDYSLAHSNGSVSRSPGNTPTSYRQNLWLMKPEASSCDLIVNSLDDSPPRFSSPVHACAINQGNSPQILCLASRCRHVRSHLFEISTQYSESCNFRPDHGFRTKEINFDIVIWGNR